MPVTLSEAVVETSPMRSSKRFGTTPGMFLRILDELYRREPTLRKAP
jgi:hypothetical protein